MLKKIVDVKPTGSQVLVELLSAQEAIGTRIEIGGTSIDTGAPQGYVVEIGPNCNCDNWGFTKGDRVLLQGKHVPLPRMLEWERDRSLVEPSMIKAVLIEEAKECCGGSACSDDSCSS